MTPQQLLIFDFAKDIFKPSPFLSGTQWANKHFVLSAESSALPGRFTAYSYQEEIINAMTDIKSQMTVVKKATRVGYNKMLNIAIAYFIDQQPSVILFYNPTESEAKGVAESEIENMIRDNPRISKLIENPNTRGRTKKERTMLKNYPGGYLEILSAESDRNMNRRTARVVIGDEIDTWKKESGSAGDTITTMLRRNQDFAMRCSILGGKPVGAAFNPELEEELSDGVSAVDYWYKKGTQEHRHLPCPHCGHFKAYEFEDFVWDKDKDKDGKTTKHYPETTHLVCEKCDKKIYDFHKRDMDNKGKWVVTNEAAIKTKIRSFHVWAMLSHSPNVTWPNIVEEFLTARKSKLKLKAFYNEVLARTWEETYEKMVSSDLHDRREHYTAQVPDGVLILTCGADIQKNRIELEVIGWGPNYESWAIEYKIFFGDTAQPEVWEALKTFILTKTYMHESENMMNIYAGCIDAGYLTTTVTDFCRPLYSRKIFATKGVTQVNAPISPRAPSKAKKNRAPIFSIGVNKAKDEIAWHISSTGGAGYMHFPRDPQYNEEYFKQLGAEHKLKDGRWYTTRARNEVIDVRVYNFTALFLAGIDLELLSHSGPVFFMNNNSRSKRRIISKGVRR